MAGISVLIPTYNRKEIVVETVHKLVMNVKFDGQLQIIVSADGDDGTYEHFQTVRIVSEYASLVVLRGPRLTTGLNTGLGANLNHMIRAASYPLLMQMDDDHWLKAGLDLNQHAMELMRHGPVAWIRLMGVSGHHYTARLQERYWMVDWDSPELYIPSNRPHLKHKWFHDFFDMYTEGLKLGETEESFCHRCKDKALSHGNKPTIPHVCVPVNLQEDIWEHVGDSWQAKGQ